MNRIECQYNQESAANRLKKLTEANRFLAEIESLDKLLLRLIDLAKEVTTAEASLIFLYDPNSSSLEIVSIKDDRFGDMAEELFKGTVQLKMGEGIAGRVAENRMPIIVDDAQSDQRFSRKADKQRNFTTRNLISVPLVYQDELLGVLSTLNSVGKPYFDQEDLTILEGFADLAAVAIIRSRLLDKRIEQERLQADLEAAAKIQKLFWPKIPDLGEGSHVWASTEPAASVGGDSYDIIPMPDGSWLVYVADVAGKGLPAALVMAALSAKIRSMAPLYEEINLLLSNVNREMYELMSEELIFTTIVLCKYRPRTGNVQIVRAGHPYPLWVTGRGFRELSNIDGIPIGVDLKADYEKSEFNLSTGEALLFISDGITEAENEAQEFFGHDGLNDYFEKAKDAPFAKDILETIHDWRGDAAMNDDLTIVEIWRDPLK